MTFFRQKFLGKCMENMKILGKFLGYFKNIENFMEKNDKIF